MGTVVYQQGFQSSQLNEPIALRLKLSSPNPHFSLPFGLPLKSHFLDSSNNTKPFDSSCWSFLSSEKENPYVQRPSSCRTLSDESLALCTENLGSETGSDVTDVEDLFSHSNIKTTTKPRTLKSKKRNVSPSDLPPPLTSMRGSQCIQMRPHRENGRLVMTGIKAPRRSQCFQADRSNGRLRLSILKDYDDFIEKEEEHDKEEEEEEKEESDMIEMKNVQTSRRCVDGNGVNRGLLNCESFSVATSLEK